MTAKPKKAAFLKEYTEELANNNDSLKKATELLIKKHQKSNLKTTTFIENLNEMAHREGSGVLREAIKSLAAELRASEATRMDLVGRLHLTVLRGLQKFPDDLKAQKELIERRNRQSEKFSSDQNAYLRTKQKNQGKVDSKLTQQRETVDKQGELMRKTETNLNSTIGQFEHDRIVDMKQYLDVFIRGHMDFYARSLENLSRAYAALCLVDSQQEEFKMTEHLRGMDASGQMATGPVPAGQQQQGQGQQGMPPQHYPPAPQQQGQGQGYSGYGTSPSSGYQQQQPYGAYSTQPQQGQGLGLSSGPQSGYGASPSYGSSSSYGSSPASYGSGAYGGSGYRGR